ncbi:MAG: hypothetical protein DWQ05_16465 [Calditrichaeota bacterium]|nr:MAG: hypothetical protein DWQ05_16465 [Calditrichota bacterium]
MKFNTNKYLLITAITVLLLAPSLQAQVGNAGMPGAYLYSGVGARALGMGGAYSAIANDVTAVYWNPAGLATQNPYQFSFMHNSLFMGTAIDFVVASAPTERYGSFGLGVLTLGSGDFEQRSVLNENLGSFSMRDMAFFVSWAEEVYPDLSVGINYKFVNQKILSHSGSGHGFDLALKAHLFDRLDAGFVLANVLSPKVTLISEAETYPMQIRTGVSTAFLEDKLTLSTEFSKTSGWGSSQLHFGAEYMAMPNLAVRMGLNDGLFTIGAGFTFRNYGLDYGTANNSELGSSQRFAINYAFGGFGVVALASPSVFSPAGEVNVTRIKLKVKSKTKIEQWIFAIVDNDGRVIRQFSGSNDPPEEIIWDGRDNRGALVSDGRFTYRFDVRTDEAEDMMANGMLVKIDTQGPIGVIGGEE